jgi:hypothetical protein
MAAEPEADVRRRPEVPEPEVPEPEPESEDRIEPGGTGVPLTLPPLWNAASRRIRSSGDRDWNGIESKAANAIWRGFSGYLR